MDAQTTLPLLGLLSEPKIAEKLRGDCLCTTEHTTKGTKAIFKKILKQQHILSIELNGLM